MARRLAIIALVALSAALSQLPGRPAAASRPAAAAEPVVGQQRAAVAVRPVGKPSLVAAMRDELSGPDALDADGNFVGWFQGRSCALRFVRLSDSRKDVVPYWSHRCQQNGQPDDLALLRSRAVWSVVGGGLSSAHATVYTARFGDAKQRDRGTVEGGCDSDSCPFRSPVIDSSGGSLVYEEADTGEGGATAWRAVDSGFKKLRVKTGRGLAVHGERIVVVDDKGKVQLRRLRDGSLIREWQSRARPPLKLGEIALSGSLLVIRTLPPEGYGPDWIDVYATATGEPAPSIQVPPSELLPRPFGGGIVFFTGRTLRYVGIDGTTSTLVTAGRRPVSFDLSGQRVFWVEHGRSRDRLYTLKLKATVKS